MTNPGNAGVWQIETRRLGAATDVWSSLSCDGASLSFGDVFALWRDNPAFRAFWTANLRAARFASFCWECPPVTRATLDTPFECVLIESPMLASFPADPGPFGAHFAAAREAVAFESLGRDALLVAPCPGGPGTNFVHLAAFCTTATEARTSTLWIAVGEALARRVADRPAWLSTAGLGVAWLHVRLDARPKYYRHAPYRDAARG